MPSSTSNSEFQRPVPALPWRALLWAAVALAAAATLAWELRARALGYRPTLNDTMDLWADRREAVKPDSLVVLGDSRAVFDIDLDEMEKGLGKRPVQLAIPGSCGYPVLEDLANDPSFHGTVVASLIPAIWTVPPEAPPYKRSLDALKRHRTRTLSQRAGHRLGMWLEERLAFMKADDLTLGQLVARVPVPDRAGSYLSPALPPYFATVDRERRTRMAEACARPGPLQESVKSVWLPLFTPPMFPEWTPKEVLEGIGRSVEARFGDTAAAVRKLRAKGAKVVWVRFPHSGALKDFEDRATPREGIWTRILAESGAPGIYYSDHAELVFDCPEWSHLSDADSVEFTRRLVPHLRAALAR